jgi:hypothetical protein
MMREALMAMTLLVNRLESLLMGLMRGWRMMTQPQQQRLQQTKHMEQQRRSSMKLFRLVSLEHSSSIAAWHVGAAGDALDSPWHRACLHDLASEQLCCLVVLLLMDAVQSLVMGKTFVDVSQQVGNLASMNHLLLALKLPCEIAALLCCLFPADGKLEDVGADFEEQQAGHQSSNTRGKQELPEEEDDEEEERLLVEDEDDDM